MTNKYLISLFILSGVVYSQNLEGQFEEAAHFNPIGTISKDVVSFAEDFYKMPGQLSMISSDDWMKVAAFGAVTGLLITQDISISNGLRNNVDKSANHFLQVGEFYGSPRSAALFPIGFYAAGLLINDEDLRTTGRQLFESILLSGLVVQGMKIVAGRARPYMNDGADDFDFFKTNNDDNSFPSGHTVVAFTISSVLANRFKNTYASIGFYSLASLTAYQRIQSGNHWFSDTFVAAAIGILIGSTITGLNESDSEDSSISNNLHVSPYYSGKTMGLSLNLDF